MYSPSMSEPLAKLVKEIRSCSLCAAHLPLGPIPIIQVSSFAKILVVGQAPGSRVHQTGIPFNDPSGDTWRIKLLEQLPKIRLTIIVGQYAQAWHLKTGNKANLTETVMAWKDYWPEAIPLPHPSPRNNIWLKRNPWFEEQILPSLKRRVKAVLK